MRDLINLPFSVSAWNAIKFLLLESIVSLVFAPLWTRYVRSKCHKIVENEDDSATVFSSEIGRFTPASVMVFRTGSTIGIGSLKLDMKYVSRAVLLLVNLLLLVFLLLTEYGSGSRNRYKGIEANVTDVQNHKALVEAIDRKAMSTSALTPLLLEPHDYEYADNQRAITLTTRVRSLFNETEPLLAKDPVQRPRAIKICGISSTSSSCDHSFDVSNVTTATAAMSDVPRIFRINNVTRLSEIFPGVGSKFHFAAGIEEIGAVGIAGMRYPEPRNYTLDCIVEEWKIEALNKSTYQLDYCVSGAGKFDMFFYMGHTQAPFLLDWFKSNPGMLNETDVFYTSGPFYAKSIFGIEQRSIYSREVALYQMFLMNITINTFKIHLRQSENIFMDSLKERFLWALLGMVSGNSMVKSVEVKSKGELATLNASFVSGCCGILVIVLILLVRGSHSTITKTFFMPVDSGEMLQIMRGVDCRNQRGEICIERKWPELCVPQPNDNSGNLSFCGGEPVPSERVPN